MPEGSIDSREFRNVMGRFATGVTVLTLQVEGQVRAMTANAISSLSLHPPLLLVCIDRNASSHPFFDVTEAFAVNILADDQRHLAEFFASHGEKAEPMGGHAFEDGPLGSPILDDVVAWAECRVVERHSGGDHTIVIGEVAGLSLARPSDSPLLFFAGKYHRIGETI